MQSVFDATSYAETVADMARIIFQRGHIEAGMEAVQKVQAFAEEKVQELVSSDALIDCHAGCAHCCIVNVAVLQPEAENVADYLLGNQNEEELLDLYQKLCKIDQETRMLDEEERIMARIKCAFLDSTGSCSIYPVRPLLCRAVTSTDAAACKDALSMIALGEEIPILSNMLQKDIFEIAFCSFGQVLREQEMEYRSQRLTSSVRNILPEIMQLESDRDKYVN